MFKKNSITQGDSLDLLKKIPDKSIDLIFADPPYNLQLKETLYRPDQTTVEAVTNDWDKFDTYQAYDEFSLTWLQECKGSKRWRCSMGNWGNNNILRLEHLYKILVFGSSMTLFGTKQSHAEFSRNAFTNAHETLMWCTTSRKSK